jgi:hypothetical protein
MKEELAVTWLGTSLVLCFFGANFCTSDDGITISKTRKATQMAFLSLALFISLWTTVSHFNLIPRKVHRLGLVIIFLAIISYIVFLIITASKQRI